MNKNLTLTFFLLLVGCSSDTSKDLHLGDDSNGGNFDDIITNIGPEFVGIWDQTLNFGSAGVNEIYFSLRLNGFGSFYDYDGDTFDQGDNCYFIESHTVLFQQRDENYTYVDLSANETIRVDLEVVGVELILTVLEDNSKLDFVRGEKAILGKKTNGLSIADFENMECK